MDTVYLPYTDEDLENLAIQLVYQEIDEIIKHQLEDFCHCKVCIQDIAAIALNHIPPIYQTSCIEKAKTLAKQGGQLKKLARIEVLKAIRKVKINSHCLDLRQDSMQT
ncbi:aminoglycoside phosphotransferase [Piscirickettsia salmonis]|uniref:Late competence development ComFB family protein n=1 Tax=Piscirickettsia salmonis TaxID=1238 RepID=A0A095BP10_PISSA|nr:late competence development ComFB family protein [Piscirickettsia salmonis]AKP73261.1 aminoglycoside phosphotransferase [Piscirickettsia salmonis LF-89 = ATCC VR-1361]ALA24267.1 late competence development ComFB family protein [Piscirickettsia salmonis]ALB21955.1 late competence development ComFB family protein [Piscirickettsia salmonis]ALY02113.1 aminoglycoside phosphotransferase [Piscirickettsia salmonis]AMA41627.1 aminoglycoside phosphotransferase [Piscirickettsia salmonis]